MKTNNFDQEYKNYQADKKEIEELLNNSIISYADKIKNELGKDILKELASPTCKTIKYTKKQRFKLWWNDLKERLNNYFFN